MPTLRATLNGKTVEKPIAQTPITIGRQPGLGFTIPAKGASREHFRIGRLKDGGWAIKDLGSTNGTLLNGEKVDGARLKHGDRIEIGDCVIEFLEAPPPEPEKPKKKKPIILKSKRDKAKKARKPAKDETPAEPEPEPEPEVPAMHIESEEQLEEWLAKREEFDGLLAGSERRVLFGKYELKKRLSEGGMGVVFKAMHSKTKLHVAVKVMKSECVD
ncbi:MAG: FHA domain-containing protein, partial [Planctomycetota bacterium]